MKAQLIYLYMTVLETRSLTLSASKNILSNIKICEYLRNTL